MQFLSSNSLGKVKIREKSYRAIERRKVCNVELGQYSVNCTQSTQGKLRLLCNNGDGPC